MLPRQRSLFASGDPEVDASVAVERIALDERSWVDLARNWLRDGDPLPHPVLPTIRSALEARYDVPFGSVGCNFYRDGNDSVAPHSDRELRDVDDALVAIVTLGARRPFLLHRKAGGASIDLAPASGDLLVMGGACQAGWNHGVPKVKRAGPRISTTWRWARPLQSEAASNS